MLYSASRFLYFDFFFFRHCREECHVREGRWESTARMINPLKRKFFYGLGRDSYAIDIAPLPFLWYIFTHIFFLIYFYLLFFFIFGCVSDEQDFENSSLHNLFTESSRGNCYTWYRKYDSSRIMKIRNFFIF